MRTISIAELKAHLSAELKKVQAGDPVTVLDHKRPVAVVAPLEPKARILKPAGPRPDFETWTRLTDIDPLPYLLEDRSDR